MSDFTNVTADKLPVNDAEFENDVSDGGVINPIGPLDSTREHDVIDPGDVPIEHLPPDSIIDNDCYYNETGDGSDSQSNSVPPTTMEDDQASQSNGCIRCIAKCFRGLRMLWATKQTEDTKGNREMVIKMTLREMVVFIIFLIDLCILTFGMTNSFTYYFTNAVTDVFVNQPSEQNNLLSTFKDIDSKKDWYEYALGPLMQGLYTTPQINSHVNMSHSLAEDTILVENQLIGLPRIRLLRVGNQSCEVNTDFKSIVSVCYGGYLQANEDRNSYGPANSSAWIYHTADELNDTERWGRLAIYSGGGYVMDLSGGMNEARDKLISLRDNNWLDRGSRAVFIEFSLYNPNVNLFCIVSLICEFPPTGGAVTSWSLRTVKLIRYVTAWDYFVMGCECLFVLFIVYYIVEECLEISRNRCAYFRNFFSILDIVILIISIICIAFSIYRTVSVNNVLKVIVENSDYYVNLDAVSFYQLVFDCAIAVTLFLVWIKLFKFISFNRTMTQLSVTMSTCAKDLACFSFMFFVVFMSFAQLGFLVFGSQVESYSSIDLAIFAQFRILLGDFTFSELQLANNILGPVYFIFYVFFMFFILLSMFLAIINDAYAEVKAEMSRQKNEYEMIDFIKKSYRTVMAKLKRKNRDKSAASQNIDDKDGNRPAHFDQWRSERLREGYTEAQIVATSNRDVDNGQSVDRAGLRRMRADLGRRKYVEKEDSDSLDISDDEDDSSMTKSGSRAGGVRRRGGDCRDAGGRGGGGRGVSHEEFSMLQRRVDRMEHSIGSIVSKIDAVLVKLESMELTKARRRETVGRLLDSIAECEGVTDESKRQHMERLVRDELERWDAESCIGAPFDPPPSGSNSSGRNMGRARPEVTQDMYSGSST